jgi:hypothetical protein
MAYRFTRQRVRLAIDLASKKVVDLSDAVSGDPAIFARAAALQIEVGLFYNAQIIDISNIVSASIAIKSAEDPDDAVAMTKTIGPNAMNKGLTQTEWETQEADKAHFIFTWLSTETADGAFGTPADTAKHWLVLSGLTDDDQLDADLFGCGKISSYDAGLSALGAPPAGQTAASMEQITAALQDFVKKVNEPGVTITLVSGVTQRRVKLTATDTGDFYPETQPVD